MSQTSRLEDVILPRFERFQVLANLGYHQRSRVYRTQVEVETNCCRFRAAWLPDARSICGSVSSFNEIVQQNNCFLVLHVQLCNFPYFVAIFDQVRHHDRQSDLPVGNTYKKHLQKLALSFSKTPLHFEVAILFT